MWNRFKSKKVIYGVGLGVGGFLVLAAARPALHSFFHPPVRPLKADVIHVESLPSRPQQIEKIKQTKCFDVLIIGGGATGSGVALDCATRGLSCALVERDDFASGTSGRSTKLIHGGVRYLEKAFMDLDRGQLHLVREALRERKHLISISPHLSRPLPIIVPLYHPFPEILFYAPYYWFGIKAYDYVSGGNQLEPSYWLGRREAREKFPMLKEEGLQGGVVYYDGQHNDSRMNLGIAMTAAHHGAAVVNHTEVISLLKDRAGRIVIGAKVQDKLTGEQYNIYAKQTINATGPFSDAVRQMADGTTPNLIKPSAGVHVVLSGRYTPSSMGLIVPKTTDGRVLFLLPWEGSTVAGTTDGPSAVTHRPRPAEEDIKFILSEVSLFLNHQVKREDVDAAWSGIRPLAVDPRHTDTASTLRDHVVEQTFPGLLTIAGGKWTTYRKMAEDTVDMVLKINEQRIADKEFDRDLIIDTKNIKPCSTISMPLIGAAGWSLQLPISLSRLGFSQDVADHIAHNYGDQAYTLAQLAGDLGETGSKRLAVGYPFIEAEVLYGCKYEFAFTAIDMISTRTRLAFLNTDAAKQALPRVISIMGKELNWNTPMRLLQYQESIRFIKTMNHVEASRATHTIRYSDSALVDRYEKRINNLLSFCPLPPDQLHKLHNTFKTVDVDHNDKLNSEQVKQFLSLVGNVYGYRQNQGVAGDPINISKLKLPAFILPSWDHDSADDRVSFEDILFSIAASFDVDKFI